MDSANTCPFSQLLFSVVYNGLYRYASVHSSTRWARGGKMVPPPDYYAILPPPEESPVAPEARRATAAGKIAYVIWGVPFFPATLVRRDYQNLGCFKLAPQAASAASYMTWAVLSAGQAVLPASSRHVSWAPCKFPSPQFRRFWPRQGLRQARVARMCGLASARAVY